MQIDGEEEKIALQLSCAIIYEKNISISLKFAQLWVSLDEKFFFWL